MAINYDFYKTTGVFGTEEKWYPRIVDNGTVETEDMMQHIETATTLTMPDLKGALTAFISHITRHLEEGRNVHIDGLGHFSLSIGGEVVQDEEGKLRLKQPSIRSVNFRPEPDFMRRLNRATFTSKSRRGRHSAGVDETKLPSILTALCAEKGHFTSQAFQKALHLTHSTAHRHLSRLCAEGVIENIGSPRLALYRMKGQK